MRFEEPVLTISSDPCFVAKFAKAAISSALSHNLGWAGLGDRIVRRNDHAQVDGLSSILDVATLRSKLEKLLQTMTSVKARDQIYRLFSMLGKSKKITILIDPLTNTITSNSEIIP